MLPRMIDGVGDGVAEAHVLEDGEVDEGGRADAVAVGIRAAVADEIETEFALRALDAAVGLAGFRAEAAELRLRVHDRAGGKVAEAPAGES